MGSFLAAASKLIHNYSTAVFGPFVFVVKPGDALPLRKKTYTRYLWSTLDRLKHSILLPVQESCYDTAY